KLFRSRCSEVVSILHLREDLNKTAIAYNPEGHACTCHRVDLLHLTEIRKFQAAIINSTRLLMQVITAEIQPVIAYAGNQVRLDDRVRRNKAHRIEVELERRLVQSHGPGDAVIRFVVPEHANGCQQVFVAGDESNLSTRKIRLHRSVLGKILNLHGAYAETAFEAPVARRLRVRREAVDG